MPNLRLNKTSRLNYLIVVIVGIFVVVFGYAAATFVPQIPLVFRQSPQIIERPDNRPLEVGLLSDSRTVINDYAEITIISNKDISLASQSNSTLQYVGEESFQKYYVLTTRDLGPGDNKIEVDIVDEVGNSQKIKVDILREEYDLPVELDNISPWENSNYIIDPDGLDTTVDRQNRLFEDYEPNDLIDLNRQLGIYTLNNAHLRSEAAYALKDMLDDLLEETGEAVTVASGYRSFYTQSVTYAGWVKELGESQANQVSARPGHSEHQLGTTVDFVNEATKWQISNEFGQTTSGKWLAENSQNYGFVIPYNQDNTDSGGYKEESWHFRYIGTGM